MDKPTAPRVLDTSALVHDPGSLVAYQGDVYVCLTVLEELDNLKERRDRSVSADARAVIRLLDQIINGHSAEEIEAGLPLPTSADGEGGRLFVGVDTELAIDDRLACGIGSEADNRIINYALHLKRKLKEDVVIVSRDINMRLKAKTIGVGAEDVALETHVSDLDLLYSGVQRFKGDLFDELSTDQEYSLSGKTYRLPRRLFNDEAQPRMYWYDEAGHIGRILHVDDRHVETELLPERPSRVWGIAPKNPRQAIALHQLTCPDFDLNVMLGPAGSGKTFLAMAAAVHMVVEEKQYRRIVVVRSRDFMDDDPGFLPGDLKEKSLPLMAGVTDALQSMHDDDHDSASSMEMIIEKANIEFTSMAYFRGRSIDHGVIVIDESQNMTHAQMKGMLSRAGKNCRIMLLGNLSQIDQRFVSAQSSGLTAAVGVYRHYQNGSVMIFDEVERGPLAEFTEKHFV
ncbi:PhoH family protein [Ferrimonas marina]|uniref:PhoH-like ATPase n=1 Tax=Ferrimonas marina TaxID=299255 RepID=A0A1M5UFV9_9GAMM|nr:PhoH family protein [Ferrimonas marina]SHH61798.1 PhoH-like ATPase [Ferrimonas marina]